MKEQGPKGQQRPKGLARFAGFSNTVLCLGAFLISATAHAADQQTSTTLVIAARSLEGEAFPNLGVLVTVPGKSEWRLTTDASGYARGSFAGTAPLNDLDVHLADPALALAAPAMAQRSAAGKIFLQLDVHAADLATLTVPERNAWIRLQPAAYHAKRLRRQPLKGTAATADIDRLAAFLHGIRVESSRGDRGLPPGPKAQLAGTILDERGAAAAGHRVLLFGVDDADGATFVADSTQTDAQGRYQFDGVTPEAYHRVEVEGSTRGVSARSGLVLSPATGTRTLPALVLLRSGGQLSGVVCYGSSPLRGVRVSTLPDRGRTLQASTDDSGWFTLGPFDGAEAMVTLQRLPDSPKISVTLKPGDDEFVIPLDVLELPLPAERTPKS